MVFRFTSSRVASILNSILHVTVIADLHRFQVAQILFLEHIVLKEKRLAVVNTHISCAWETPVKQLAQVQELMTQIGEIIPRDVPLVLAGDMNSLFGSGAYVALLLTRSLLVSDQIISLGIVSLLKGLSLC